MDVVKRYKGNPILTRYDVPYDVVTVHNAAVVKFFDEYMMVFRSHKRNGRSILGLARSKDGFSFKVDPEPFMVPSTEGIFSIYEAHGIEDPRITCIDDEYWMTYSAYSKYGIRIGLAKIINFERIERYSLITGADYRNAVLFPEKINGLYVRLDRPHSEVNPWAIWMSYSPDLRYWGDSRLVINTIKYHWDEMKIGPGAPPIKTDAGWLNIYHGVFPTMDGSVYRLGVALHELNDPAKIIGVSDNWILQPEEPYELVGYVHNVVFTCAAVPYLDDQLLLYWGAADTVMCAGTAKISDLIDLCINNSRPAISGE